jgi:hypothetical protein
MKNYYLKTKKRKILLISIVLACLNSCQKTEEGTESVVIIDAAEFTSTEKVVSGSFEISGTTEEAVEKTVSGSVTIEGVSND